MRRSKWRAARTMRSDPVHTLPWARKTGERCALGFRKNTVFRCLDYSRPAVPAMDGPAPRETSIGDGNAQNSLQKSSYLRRRDQVRHPRGGRLWRPCKRNSLDYGRDPKSSNDKNVSMQEEFPRVSCLHRTPADAPHLPIQPQDPGSNYEPGAPSVLF